MKKNQKNRSALRERLKKIGPSPWGGKLGDLFLKPRAFSLSWAFVMLAGTIWTALLILQLERFRWLGAPFVIPQPLWGLLFLMGMVVMGLGFRVLPTDKAPKGDLSRWVAYPLLAIIFGVGAFLRFYRADQAYMAYWDDPTNDVNFLVRVADAHDFLVIYPEGATEPLFTYLGGILWMMFPAMKALFVQRLTGNIFNLAALWVLYRLGREVSGKRLVGVILAALAAVSKPILLHNLSGQNALTLTLSVGFYLWCQFRVFRKPSLSHFLQWGIVLALGLYTYNAIRTWYFFLALVTLGWVLWTRFGTFRPLAWKWKVPSRFQTPGRDHLDRIFLFIPARAALWAVLLFALGYMSFFIDHILFLFHANPFSWFWGLDLRLWAVLQGVFGFFFYQAFRCSSPKDRPLYGWALGLLVAGVISHPLALHTEAAVRISNISLLPKSLAGWFGTEFYQRLFSQAYMAYQFIFTIGSDRTDMNLYGDPLLDYHAEVLVVLGLLFALVRPTWPKTLFLVGIPVGIVPFLLTSDSHGGKVLGCMVPLLLLAALALGQWLGGTLFGAGRMRWMGLFLSFVLIGFWGWETRGTFIRVFDKWWYEVVNDDLAVGQEIDKALPKSRVYLAPCNAPGQRFFSAYVQAVLHDGNPVYVFQEKNTIPVLKGQVLPAVTVVVSGYSPEVIEKLKEDFPKAQWEPHWQFYQKSKDETPFLYTVAIQAQDIPLEDGKCLRFEERSAQDWVRRVYLTGFGLRGGLITTEDASATLDTHGLDCKLKAFSGDGEWDVPAEGTYEFSSKNPNYAKVWVDGKCLLHSTREGEYVPVSGSMHLEKGTHHLRYFTYLMYGADLAPVTIESTANDYKKVLGGP